MIIVFGSLNMDLVMTPDHAPAAGETIIIENLEQLPGGKGANQAVTAARFGAKTCMVGSVGQDGFGTDLIETLRQQKVDTSLIARGTKSTGTAMIILEPSGENRIIVIAGTNFESKAEQVPDKLLNSDNTLLMQMETRPQEVNALACRAYNEGTKVILNLAPFNDVARDSFKYLDFLILNETEIEQLAGHQDYQSAALSLAKEYTMTCIVTLGEKGSIACTSDGRIHFCPALPLSNIIDTTGAGDAFCGTFAAALDEGERLEDAMEIATVAAGLACLKKGALVSYPDREEIFSTLKANASKTKRLLSEPFVK